VSEPDLAARLQALVDRDVRSFSQMPGRMLHVLGPGLDVEVAAGLADRSTGAPLSPGSRFRTASVTKPFVAAAALRLVEDERLSIDVPISDLLPSAFLDVLQGGGYRPEAITVRHLLSHTSGIYDFAADCYDPSIDGFLHETRRNPDRRWSRLDQVRFAVEHGRPYGEPGQVYAYSDTGACLVGEIIERVTGVSMGAALRDLLGFDALGLRHTYHESVEPDPPDLPPLAHQYEGDYDVDRYDASVDLWGGGGLVSTCADLSRFFRALLRGEIFHRLETLEVMCTSSGGVPAFASSPAGYVDVTNDPENAGLFLYRTELAGQVAWGHGGYWGTTVWACPNLDLTVTAQHGQSDMPAGFDRSAIVREVVAALGAS
jgi:D-alanyl-D-alanine carboxypeptidase